MSQQAKAHRILVASLAMAAVVSFTLIVAPSAGFAQQAPARKAPAKPAPTKAQPKYKGVWEQVPFPEKIDFADVFFVSPEVGYASGAHGTIVKTTDGGANWTALAGGDPQSPGETIERLRFLDETHGWAVQGGDLLRTTDGETWEPWSTFKGAHSDYVFLSETDGVALGHPAGGIIPNHILRTEDGGKTWKAVFYCKGELTVEGMIRQFDGCTFGDLHFATPLVGYATAYMGWMNDLPILAKTEDGGFSWTFLLGPGAPSARLHEVFFLDESTGFIRVNDNRIFTTTDGGQTWRGLVGSLEPNLRFTDPEVGWTFSRGAATYTTEGGKRWSTRRFEFPVEMNALSLPRRDRAYMAGPGGMIYRYRVVPISERVPNSLDWAPMPEFDSPLDEQVEQLDSQVEAFQEAVTEAAPAAEGDAEAGAEGGEMTPELTEQVEQAEETLEAMEAEAPEFTGKYKNLNLLMKGFQMSQELPAQIKDLKESFKAFKQVKKDPQAAVAAATEIQTKVQGLVGMVRGFFGKR